MPTAFQKVSICWADHEFFFLHFVISVLALNYDLITEAAHHGDK